MAGSDGRRGFATALLPALALVLAAPWPTHAADLGTQVLPGSSHAVVVVDLDADGANELVRIVSDRGTQHVVEAWAHDGETWAMLGEAPIPRLDETVVRQGRVRGADASALLVWHVEGRARVLVVTRLGEASANPAGDACCLSMFELIQRSGTIELEPRPADGGAAYYVQALDMDADGTDELILAAPFRPDESGVIEVLRWEGGAFGSVFREVDPEGLGQFWAAETDGIEGDDIIIGPSGTGEFRRVAWVDGSVRVEHTRIDLGQRFDGFISGVADGAIVLTLASELRIVRWPRGGGPQTTARLAGVIFPFAGIVESGSGTLLVIQDSALASIERARPVTVYDQDLSELGVLTVAPTPERLVALFNRDLSNNRGWQNYLFPYGGPMPGASPRTPEGFVWSGVLVQADGEGGFEARPISPMAGLWPIGRAGPENGWMAVTSGYLAAGSVATLYGAAPFPGSGRTSLVPFDDLLRADDAAASLELRGAVRVGEAADGVTPLLAGEDGFEVAITAPTGSWVTAWDGRTLNELTVEGDSLTVEFRAPPGGEQEKDQPIDAWLIVATPDGRTSVGEWDGTFVREPPQVAVAGRTDALSFSATLKGTVGRHATVTVDGRQVTVDSAGRFVASVEAWPWPRGVEVIARDLFGHEITNRVEVVGLYDYRTLPWAAIVAAATVIVGLVLFVRIPRRRRGGATDDGDGRLEELDPIDGARIPGP
jgi:hypothetical protein